MLARFPSSDCVAIHRSQAGNRPRHFNRRSRGWLASLVLGLTPLTAAAAAPSGYAELVRRIAPSVVTILVVAKGEDAGERAAERARTEAAGGDLSAILGRLAGGAGSSGGGLQGGLGSGFVVGRDGLIVTNRHVVAGARAIHVRLAGGREVPATVVGLDVATDLALLRVSAGALPALEISDSRGVAIGDPVVAIGNPFGLGQTVTSGILSARGRMLEEDPYIDFLQTDAAINLGNSGGPLLAADGTVIGVTSAIVSPSGGSVGLGFAIPGETVRAVVAELKARGRVSRGYLGILAQPMTAALGRALGVDGDTGAILTRVDSQGPSAGVLQVGDVLQELGTHPLNYRTLGKTMARIPPGTTVIATVVRGGDRLRLPVTLGQLPEDVSLSQDARDDTWVGKLGLGATATTPAILRALQVEEETGGLIVTQLRPAGPGALAGLRVGDVVTHAGTERLTAVEQLTHAMTPSPEVPLLLRVIRAGQPRFVAVTGVAEP